MLYDRSENERALENLFSRQDASDLADALTIPVTYLVHFSAHDVEILRESVEGSIDLFLSPHWYSEEVITEEMGSSGGSSLGDVLRRSLFGSMTGAIIPIHGSDFFTCVRQKVFEATLGESHFHILGRLRMHELAAANFIDDARFPSSRISDLTSDDFEWLYEQTFSLSQRRAVVTAYIDAMYGAHVPSTFDHWRRDPDTYFPRYFRQFGVDTSINYDNVLEPHLRPETERRVVNWFSDKLRAQISSWNSSGWPELDGENGED